MFSIAVPTYNRSRLLRRCLDSIKKQTFQDYEVLILDDHSTDDTQDMVKEYTKDARFKYVRFEKNLGYGDRVYKKAQDMGLFSREWIVLVGDDEYFYNEYHLERIGQSIVVNGSCNFIAVDCAYGYSDIEIFSDDKTLPDGIFAYKDLTLDEKEALNNKMKVVYKRDFLIENDIFNAEQQNKHDSCFEVSYSKIYEKANLLYVPGIAHVFGITPSARRKYVNFYNWIVSNGMLAFDIKDKNLAYHHLKMYYNDPSMCLNAFFEWGGEELAKVLPYFILDNDFPNFLREFAEIYSRKFQDRLDKYYNAFNAILMNEKEKENAIHDARNVVIYGENSWRQQIENHFIKKKKNVLFIVDDNKKGYKRYTDILKEKDSIDLVFISSGSPKIINQMLSKINPKENNIKVATLIARDEEWGKRQC